LEEVRIGKRGICRVCGKQELIATNTGECQDCVHKHDKCLCVFCEEYFKDGIYRDHLLDKHKDKLADYISNQEEEIVEFTCKVCEFEDLTESSIGIRYEYENHLLTRHSPEKLAEYIADKEIKNRDFKYGVSS
jgi:hypothetical protein